MKKTIIALTAIAMTILPGCFPGDPTDAAPTITGDDCVYACEAAADCRGDAVDCEGYCGHMESKAAEDGCIAEWDILVECAADHADSCNDGSGCNAENQAHAACRVASDE